MQDAARHDSISEGQGAQQNNLMMRTWSLLKSEPNHGRDLSTAEEAEPPCAFRAALDDAGTV